MDYHRFQGTVDRAANWSYLATPDISVLDSPPDPACVRELSCFPWTGPSARFWVCCPHHPLSSNIHFLSADDRADRKKVLIPVGRGDDEFKEDFAVESDCFIFST